MKSILTHGSKWPLQPLDEENRIKDVEDALKLRFIGNMLYLGQKRVCDGVVAPLRR
jgi:hypothetical protein